MYARLLLDLKLFSSTTLLTEYSFLQVSFFKLIKKKAI
jgi:hypothetical protein